MQPELDLQHLPLNPALKSRGRQTSEFQASWDHVVRQCLKNKVNKPKCCLASFPTSSGTWRRESSYEEMWGGLSGICEGQARLNRSLRKAGLRYANSWGGKKGGSRGMLIQNIAALAREHIQRPSLCDPAGIQTSL